MIYYEQGRVMIRTAFESDLDTVAANLRREDAEELRAEGYYPSARAALGVSFAASTVRLAALRDGVPVAVFGIVPDALAGSRAVVWLLGAEGLRRIPKTFVRASRAVIAHFLTLYPVLYNRVDARYTGTVRWLEACGAEFAEPVPVGPGGHPFQSFTIRRA